MTDYTIVDKFESSIATMKPTARQRRLTLVLASALLLATAIIAPFGAFQLPRIDGFIPATEPVIVITALFTAVLLFSQVRIIGSRGLLLLASGYLFTALMVLLHLLTFPGAFAPSGLLGAGLSTTAWLFIFGHLGFPISVIGYAYLIDERRALTRSAIYWSVAFVIGLACVIAWIVTVHHDALPALFVDQIHLSVLGNRVTIIDFVISVIALVVLWLRQRAVLDLWLMVAVSAVVGELGATAFVITSRFSLGFYAQRVYSLAASTMVLSALLAEATVLYARLANAIALLQRERASKMLNVQAAVGALTHQIRQPLTGIGTKAAAARRFLAQTQPDVDRVQRIHDDIVRATSQTNEAIESVNGLFKDADEPQGPININEIIVECLQALQQELDEQMIAVRTDLDTSLPLIAGHKGQLRQVVLNLMQNAIEAMEASAKGERNLRLETKQQDQGVTISVQDTGPGIEQQSATRIFDAFVTTKGKGTGLGLAISRMVIELHGGRIFAHSEPGSGARFQIVLPIKIRPETAT